jgi:hypothetical protein
MGRGRGGIGAEVGVGVWLGEGVGTGAEAMVGLGAEGGDSFIYIQYRIFLGLPSKFCTEKIPRNRWLLLFRRIKCSFGSVYSITRNETEWNSAK